MIIQRITHTVFLGFFLLLPLAAQQTFANEKLIAQIEDQLSILEDKMETMNTRTLIENAHEALRLSEKIIYKRGVVKAHYVLGVAHNFAGDYKKALNHYTEIGQNEESRQYPHYLSLMHRGKGELFQNVGLNEWAKQEYQKGIDNAKKIKRHNYRHITLLLLYTQMAGLYYNPDDSHKMDTFVYYMNQAEKELEQADQDFILPVVPIYLVLKSEYYMHNNAFDSAKQCIDNLFVQIKKFKNADRPYVYMTAGNYYNLIQQPDSADYFYRLALKRSHESGIINDLPKVYKKMSAFYANNGQPDSAKQYHRLFIDAENLQTNFKLESSREIVSIILNNINIQNRNRTKRTALIAMFTTGIVAFVTANVIYFHRRKKIKKKNESKINQLNRKLDNAFEEVIKLAKNNDPTFVARFQEVYPEFHNKLSAKHPNLTPAELQLCAMTYLNFTTKQIAEYSFIEFRSVQTRRSRLRKKINLNSKIDLNDYLKNL